MDKVERALRLADKEISQGKSQGKVENYGKMKMLAAIKNRQQTQSQSK